ncbi:MAG: hypothetical protein COA78_25260 [Blastopirellula sp.]|nr:MAG: hypothetical protein COA78_25260 [Blastopirellula sp.]
MSDQENNGVISKECMAWCLMLANEELKQSLEAAKMANEADVIAEAAHKNMNTSAGFVEELTNALRRINP